MNSKEKFEQIVKRGLNPNDMDESFQELLVLFFNYFEVQPETALMMLNTAQEAIKEHLKKCPLHGNVN